MIVEGTAYWASIKTPNTTFEPALKLEFNVANLNGSMQVSLVKVLTFKLFRLLSLLNTKLKMGQNFLMITRSFNYDYYHQEREWRNSL